MPASVDREVLETFPRRHAIDTIQTEAIVIARFLEVPITTNNARGGSHSDDMKLSVCSLFAFRIVLSWLAGFLALGIFLGPGVHGEGVLLTLVEPQ